MRRAIFIVICVLFIDSLYAQRTPQTDSIRYYQRERAQMASEFMDSLHSNPRYMALLDTLETLRSKSDNYMAFGIYFSVSSTDFRKFNMENALDNFSALSDPMLSIGYGISSKKNRRIFDLNLTAFGISKKAKRGSEYIKSSVMTFFQMEWGYDLIRNNQVNFYPYAGVGFRSSSLIYKSSLETNPLYTNVTNIMQNNKSFNASNFELGYQAGMGAEVVISKSSRFGGTILFVKAGTNMAFEKKPFDIEGIKYQPDFKYGALTGTIGFKFFGR